MMTSFAHSDMQRINIDTLGLPARFVLEYFALIGRRDLERRQIDLKSLAGRRCIKRREYVWRAGIDRATNGFAGGHCERAKNQEKEFGFHIFIAPKHSSEGSRPRLLYPLSCEGTIAEGVSPRVRVG